MAKRERAPGFLKKAPAGIQLVSIVFELHEDPPRRVGLEYSFGKRAAGRYPVGKTVKLNVDPDNPELITPAE